MAPRLKVQVWIYRKNAGALEVLMLKMQPKRGGFWQPVTGGVEDGEAPRDAAVREGTEETGLTFGPLRDLHHQFEFDARGKTFREHAYALEALKGPENFQVKLDPHEHVEYRWVSPEEALKLVHFESNAQVLKLLLTSLASK